MSYDYQKERPKIFTESGVDTLLLIRSKCERLARSAGAFTAERAMVAGDTWLQLAVFDYLVERGDLLEITDKQQVAAQHRTFRWRAF